MFSDIYLLFLLLFLSPLCIFACFFFFVDFDQILSQWVRYSGIFVVKFYLSYVCWDFPIAYKFVYPISRQCSLPIPVENTRKFEVFYIFSGYRKG